ncbi:MAG: 30S ribosomal protein S21, partial [Patescibacteria group bacterium]
RRRLHIMVLVIKRKGESKDSMFRKFTRSFIDEEIVDTLRKKMFYKKPSLKRKEEEKERMKNRSLKRRKVVFKKVYKRI